MTEEELFELKTHLFEAYYDCRRNKRNTINAIAFELNFEEEVQKLYEEVAQQTYQPGRSVAFLVYKPVMREIFAADFRDRVIHHFVINRMNPIFANIYLNDFDHFVKRILKVRYYGRYVDDFILMDTSKEKLLHLREQIRSYLKTRLDLDVHPKKEYLQHYSKGFSFLGAYIKPYRRYVGNRTVRNLNILLHETDWMSDYDFLTGNGREKRDEKITSYFGFMKHFKAHRLVEKIKGSVRDIPL
jgi:hypothetical protein